MLLTKGNGGSSRAASRKRLRPALVATARAGMALLALKYRRQAAAGASIKAAGRHLEMDLAMLGRQY